MQEKTYFTGVIRAVSGLHNSKALALYITIVGPQTHRKSIFNSNPPPLFSAITFTDDPD